MSKCLVCPSPTALAKPPASVELETSNLNVCLATHSSVGTYALGAALGPIQGSGTGKGDTLCQDANCLDMLGGPYSSGPYGSEANKQHESPLKTMKDRAEATLQGT